MAVLSCESAMAMAVTDGDAHGGPPQLLPAQWLIVRQSRRHECELTAARPVRVRRQGRRTTASTAYSDRPGTNIYCWVKLISNNTAGDEAVTSLLQLGAVEKRVGVAATMAM